MIELKPLTLLLQGLPETISMTALVCALIGRSFDWKRIIAVGVLQGITLYLVRLLPLTFGIHIFIGIFTFSLYTHLVMRDRYYLVIKSCILAYLLLLFLETVFHILVLRYLNLSQVEASQNLPLWIPLGWLQVIVISITTLLIYRHNSRKGLTADDRTEPS